MNPPAQFSSSGLISITTSGESSTRVTLADLIDKDMPVQKGGGGR